MDSGQLPGGTAQSTLFGHMALRFGSHPENLATEALLYLLQTSAAARAGLTAVCAAIGLQLQADLRYRTQVAGPDDAIPDLVGSAPDGTQVLLLEAKFWAGLTDRQPVEYLRRLPPGVPALLLVVAPERRFPTLWGELLRRCYEADLPIHEQPSDPGAPRVATVTDHRLALVSWRALLGSVMAQAEARGEPSARADVEQLLGLTQRMDSDAFLPLRSEELSSAIPERIGQYVEIVDDLKDQAVACGLCSTSAHGRLRMTSGPGKHGHYLWMHDCGVYLHTDVRKWSRFAATPFWLNVGGRAFKNWANERPPLAQLEQEVPPRLFAADDALAVPLYPPLGEEKPAVIQALLSQLRHVHALLGVTTAGS